MLAEGASLEVLMAASAVLMEMLDPDPPLVALFGVPKGHESE